MFMCELVTLCVCSCHVCVFVCVCVCVCVCVWWEGGGGVTDLSFSHPHSPNLTRCLSATMTACPSFRLTERLT